MRALRNVIDIGLPFIGVAIILGAMISMRESPRSQVALVGLGMVLIQLGVWKTAHRILPDRRRFLALRNEVDQFMKLVRQLNKVGLAVKEDNSPENRLALENVQATMQQSVQHMAEVAGKTDAEIAAERQSSARASAPVGTEPSKSPEDPVTVPEEPLVSKNP